MNAKKIALAALGAAFVFGATAPTSLAAPGDRGHKGHGQRHEMRGPMMKERAFIYLLKNADADKDGKVTKAELMAFEEKKFAEIDADKDGSLTPGEFRAYRKAAMEAVRKDHPRPEREEAKKDGDKKPEERAEGKEGKRHHAKGPDRHGKGWGKGRGAMAFIRFADTDENGQVSKAEATAAAEKLFTFMDTNKDGVISIDDLPDRPL